VSREREGELIDKMMFKNILDIFIEVRLETSLPVFFKSSHASFFHLLEDLVQQQREHDAQGDPGHYYGGLAFIVGSDCALQFWRCCLTRLALPVPVLVT
jgi:hypothetical protein